MATLTRKTLGITIRCIEQWSRTDIELFLYELKIPDELNEGDSKKKLLLNVFQGLERQERHDLLRTIVFATVGKLSGDNLAWLKDSLLKDGFVVYGEEIAEDVPIAEDNRTSLELLVNRNAGDLDTATLLHHLEESIDLFRQEKWDSSILHARNFVEQLLKDLARTIATYNNETPDIGQAVKVRNYLEHVGFLDKPERKKLVDGVYGYFSEKGAHPGISEQSIARVCMHILWAFSFYILEKFEDWKKQNT